MDAALDAALHSCFGVPRLAWHPLPQLQVFHLKLMQIYELSSVFVVASSYAENQM
jgi:hypothetical protein